MSYKKIEIDFHGRPLSIEMGKMAKQANAAAVIKYGETMVLVSAVCGTKDKEGINFLPLSVEYIERYSAAGKIPGGFFKREGRQTEREILISRLTDRPLRPLFPETYCRETQVITTVFSYDKENDPDILSLLGASTALHVSDIPFMGPVAAVKVGRVDGKWVCNPTVTQLLSSDVNFVIAASKEAITMVEGEAKEVPEKEVLEGLKFGFESLQPLLEIQEELRKAIGKEKFAVAQTSDAEPLRKKVSDLIMKDLSEILKIKEKTPRYKKLAVLKALKAKEMVASDETLAGKENQIGDAIDAVVSAEIRRMVVDSQKRLDHRSQTDIRNIDVEVSVLPRAHGSALFTRGETQALVTTTLGTTEDEQMIDNITGFTKSGFMLHYNFPPFSVGETKPLRGPARREIGHGVLAHRAIAQVLPNKESFPYTVRIVSDVLESHGSSSMATVCGATLSLMDAGVPIKAPVAGIAMGLVKEGNKILVLSDISGDEDHIGDMDFKVAGTKSGVTAVQMDIKVTGISWDIFERALEQAKEGRLHILDRMTSTISEPRQEKSKYSPRIETIQIKPDKIREVIGSGGKVIRGIVEQSGAKVEVNDEGIVTIASENAESLQKARSMIEGIVAEAEVGRTYTGKVTRVMDYGAFVEILPGKEGLCHISEFLTTEKIYDANEVVSVGDEIEVKCIGVEPPNRIKLSHREVLQPGSSQSADSEGSERSDRGGDRGGRGGRSRFGGGDRGGRGGRPNRNGGGDRGRGRDNNRNSY